MAIKGSRKGNFYFTVDTLTSGVKLPKENRAILDFDDLELAKSFTWGFIHGYAATEIRREDGSSSTLGMHQLVMGFSDPRDLMGLVVHHRNGDKLDNRKHNLLVLSKEDHDSIHRDERQSKALVANRKRSYARNGNGKLRWAYLQPSGRWLSQIKIPGGAPVKLGTFDTEKQAHDAGARAMLFILAGIHPKSGRDLF